MNDIEAKTQALRRALTWLGDNAHELLAMRPTWLRLVKRIAELLMLVDYLVDGELGRVDPMFEREARRWLDATWKVTRQADFFAEAIASDATWTSLAMTYAGFQRRGLRNERLEQLFADRAGNVEHEWFVDLATSRAYERLGIPYPRDVRELANNAWCVRIPSPQIPDIGRMYETTHVIMWLADHESLSVETRDRLRSFIPTWCAHYRNAHNPDVTGELVLAAHHLGACTDAETWQWLLELQTADGSLREMDIPSVALGRFHVTIVLAMALAACLGGRCSQGVEPVDRGR